MPKIILYFLLFICFSGHSQLNDAERESLRSELTLLVNDLRQSKGLAPLVNDDKLRDAAQFHSEYMAKNDDLSHSERSGKYKSPKDRVIAFEGKEFEIVGENILHTIPQDFPLSKKALKHLALDMFEQWKNSPPHYANLTHSEYTFGDFGFKTQPSKKTVFATQVFGNKGVVIENQISNNAYDLTLAPTDCEDAYKNFSNIVMNLGNGISTDGQTVDSYQHSIQLFKRIFSEPNDGIAIDIVQRNQFLCGQPNQLDFSPIYDGVLLKPVFRDDLLTNNRALSEYRVITEVGKIPESMQNKDQQYSVVLIKNGQKCKYIVPVYIPSRKYDLRPIEPIVLYDSKVKLLKEGIVASQEIQYTFNTNIIKPNRYPKFNFIDLPIHSIDIKSFSSVEGDSIKNASLHIGRAKSIQNHIVSKTKTFDTIIRIESKENWDLMNFQLHYNFKEEIAILSHDSIKSIIANRSIELPWDSLLFNQRKSSATIHYLGVADTVSNFITEAEVSLRTGIATNNPELINRALYEYYHSEENDPSILFEQFVFDYCSKEPKVVANYTALLTNNCFYDIELSTKFLFHWYSQKERLSQDSKFNLLCLYTLLGNFLLENWDTPAERLSNVIHPNKINDLSANLTSNELILNLHLTFIQYFGQINDGVNISKSFDYISNFFKNNSLHPEDDVDLTLFYNKWSMYQLTENHLLPKFKSQNINEDGVFILSQVIALKNQFNYVNPDQININKKAIELNSQRWCNWMYRDFQLLRDIELKALYCETCNQ